MEYLFCNTPCKPRYYYTLEECARPTFNRPFSDILHKNTQPNLKDVCDTFYSEVPTWAKTDGADFSYLNELWERLRHYFLKDGYYFWYSDKEYDVTSQADLTELHTEVKNRMFDLLETIYETKDKYIELIKDQATLKAKILDDINSQTETWFNDTPQASGTYTDEEHTTTYNKTKSTISLGDVATQLSIVDQAMNDYYDNWLREFRKFVIVE